MGWIMSQVQQHCEMLRLWNRLINFDNHRLTKKIFLWDKSIKKNNWCSEVYKILQNLDMISTFTIESLVDVNLCKKALHDIWCDNWKTEVINVPKLRTYITYKTHFAKEPYLDIVKNRGERAVLSQLRVDVLPLSIEMGRFSNSPLEYRLCLLFDEDNVEDESHFLFRCTLYSDLRSTFINCISQDVNYFHSLSDAEKLMLIMNADNIKHTA